MRAIRVKGLMTNAWDLANPDGLTLRRQRFVTVIRDLLEEAGVRVCTDQRTGNPCIWAVYPIMHEVHQVPVPGGGQDIIEAFYTTEVLAYVDCDDDDDFLTNVMDNLALGAEFPFSSWRMAEFTTPHVPNVA